MFDIVWMVFMEVRVIFFVHLMLLSLKMDEMWMLKLQDVSHTIISYSALSSLIKGKFHVDGKGGSTELIRIDVIGGSRRK